MGSDAFEMDPRMQTSVATDHRGSCAKFFCFGFTSAIPNSKHSVLGALHPPGSMQYRRCAETHSRWSAGEASIMIKTHSLSHQCFWVLVIDILLRRLLHVVPHLEIHASADDTGVLAHGAQEGATVFEEFGIFARISHMFFKIAKPWR